MADHDGWEISTMTGTPDNQQPEQSATVAPPLAEEEFHEIFAKVPRLTVELVVQGPTGVLLAMRQSGPCVGLWHLPGGTVRFGEPLADAVRRVASMEIGREVEAGPFLGYIEYPSHYLNGLDSPVGLAFLCPVDGGYVTIEQGVLEWFMEAPSPMHTEQIDFLVGQGLLSSGR